VNRWNETIKLGKAREARARSEVEQLLEKKKSHCCVEPAVVPRFRHAVETLKLKSKETNPQRRGVGKFDLFSSAPMAWNGVNREAWDFVTFSA